MEVEKKKIRPIKRMCSGPVIRYQSLSMPAVNDAAKPGQNKRKRLHSSLIENGNPSTDMEIEPMIVDDKENTTNTKQRVERTFISFDNDVSDEFFSSIFKKENPPKKDVMICPMTKLPAKYFDPVTSLPYRNIQALKIIREAYYQLIETIKPPSAENWIQWRRKLKDTAKND